MGRIYYPLNFLGVTANSISYDSNNNYLSFFSTKRDANADSINEYGIIFCYNLGGLPQNFYEFGVLLNFPAIQIFFSMELTGPHNTILYRTTDWGMNWTNVAWRKISVSNL